MRSGEKHQKWSFGCILRACDRRVFGGPSGGGRWGRQMAVFQARLKPFLGTRRRFALRRFMKNGRATMHPASKLSSPVLIFSLKSSFTQGGAVLGG